MSAAGFDGVLWELATDHKPNVRRIGSLARRLPIVSYSAERHPELESLSRRIGFACHLKAPLSPAEVEHKLTLVSRPDLATRLRQFQRALAGRLQRREVLTGLIRAAHATLEPSRIAELMVERASDWIPARTWALVVADSAGDLSLLGERGLTSSVEPVVYAVANWVIRHGTEFTTADLRHDRRVSELVDATVVAFPLACRGRTLAALVGVERGASGREPKVTDGVLAGLYELLEVPAIALDSALLLKRAEALSVTDDLTRLYNSRYLNQVLRREAKRASRSGHPLSVLFVDLDGFKGINDRYGHLSGSRALVEAAALMRASARETDVVARFGGDEFAIVLPDTGREGALSVAQRVRERIAAHRFLADQGVNYHLTASVGVATYPDVAATPDQLLHAADQAMYRVKSRGKDGIEVAVNETATSV